MQDFLRTYEEIQKDSRYPKLRIDYFGNGNSAVYVNGVVIGKGVRSVIFKHRAKKHAKLVIDCDPDELEFFTVKKRNLRRLGIRRKQESIL